MSNNRFVLNQLQEQLVRINRKLMAEGVYHAGHGVLQPNKDDPDPWIHGRYMFIDGDIHYNNRQLVTNELYGELAQIRQRLVGVNYDDKEKTLHMQFVVRYSAQAQDKFFGGDDDNIEKAAIAIHNWIIKGILPEKDPSNLLFLIRNKRE